MGERGATSEPNTRCWVVFNNPYEKAPVITTSPYSSFRQNYIVADVTAKGFTILLESSAEADLKFSWQAVPTGQ